MKGRFYHEVLRGMVYYYGEDDERTDYEKEFTFYVQETNLMISSDSEMIAHLRNTFMPSEKYNVDQINCVDPKHYPFMTRWFEIAMRWNLLTVAEYPHERVISWQNFVRNVL